MLFGHHFAAITGSGPLIGPTLAAQFGYAPGLIWLVAGCCLAGAVHDFIILWASVRRNGKSLAEIVRSEIGPVAYLSAAIAILFIVVIAIAGLGIIVVNALAESPWGTFTIAMTIPLAIFMGFYMYVWRKGRVVEATVIGIIGLMACVIFGEPLNHPGSAIGSMFRLTREQLVFAIAIYGFAASVLPVWLLLSPRDYLSSFMKIGTIALLVLGIVIVNPVLQMPALTEYVNGGGPDHPRTALPVLLHHHRVRRDLRLPFPGRLGHHAEDGRQGDAHPPDRLRRDADRRPGRRAGAHRRLRDAPRRLLRDQHDQGGLREPWACPR